MKQFFRGTNVSAKALFIAAATLVGSTAALGDTMTVSFLAPGVQTPLGITTHYTTFNAIVPGSAPSYTSHFNGSAYTGTYSGGLLWTAADAYGGAGGSGTYAETFSGYTLTINPSVNYFGLWFSALDGGNELTFYRDDTLVYSFGPQDLIRLVGACPGSPYCGNPNSGADANEQFVYLNFYDSTANFNRIVFSQAQGGGFESDNHAVAELLGPPGGTLVNGVPEPGTSTILLVGGVVLATFGRRRRRAV